MGVIIYTAAKMTGRDQKEMVELAKENKKKFESLGVTVLDPILEENVKPLHKLLVDTPMSLLKGYWKRDKEMIRKAHVVVDTTPEMKSEGSAHEIGYARYFLWMPVIRLYTKDTGPTSAIVFFEDDLVVRSVEEAAIQINKYWGTWCKRFLWRLGIYNKSYIKAIWYRLLKWF